MTHLLPPPGSDSTSAAAFPPALAREVPSVLRRWMLVIGWIACGGLLSAAIDTTAWSHRQPLSLEQTDWVKLALPVATLDRARADLADVRVLNAQGDEVPYAILRPGASAPSTLTPRAFRAELQEGATVLTVETGTDRPLVSVALATSARAFVKPVTVAVSNDGSLWEVTARDVPLYRQGPDVQLSLTLPPRSARWIRLTVDDRRSPPVAFTGASLTAGLTLAAGGVLDEILKDSTNLLLPSTAADITAALDRLRLAPLLTGYRGAAAVDHAALVAVILSLQALFLSDADLAEIEINPLFVGASGVTIVDALIHLFA